MRVCRGCSQAPETGPDSATSVAVFRLVQRPLSCSLPPASQIGPNGPGHRDCEHTVIFHRPSCVCACVCGLGNVSTGFHPVWLSRPPDQLGGTWWSGPGWLHQVHTSIVERSTSSLWDGSLHPHRFSRPASASLPFLHTRTRPAFLTSIPTSCLHHHPLHHHRTALGSDKTRDAASAVCLVPFPRPHAGGDSVVTGSKLNPGECRFAGHAPKSPGPR